MGVQGLGLGLVWACGPRALGSSGYGSSSGRVGFRSLCLALGVWEVFWRVLSILEGPLGFSVEGLGSKP